MTKVTTQWVLDLIDNISSPIRAIEQNSLATSKAVDSISESGKRLSSGFGGVIKKLGIAAAAVFMFAQARAAVIQGENDYMALAESETKLAKVMSNTMDAATGEVQAILDLANAQEKLGIVEKPVQIAGAQELATYLTKKETLEQLLPVMNDMIAQQLGLTATQEGAVNIATMLGKVMDGQVGALSRYGYKFDDAQEKILKYGTESQRVAVLTDVVSSAVGGVNEALAQTPAGKMKKVEIEMGDLKERVGGLYISIKEALLPVFEEVISVIENVVSWLEENKTSISDFVGTVMSVAIPVLSFLWELFQRIGGAIKDILLPVYDTLTSETGNVSSFFSELAGVVLDVVDVFLAILVPVLSTVVEWISALFSLIARNSGIFKAITIGAIGAAVAFAIFKIAAFLLGGGLTTLAITAKIACAGISTAIYSIPLIGWIAAAIGALIALVTYFYNTSAEFRGFLWGVWEAVKAVFTGIGKFIKDVLEGVWHLIKGVFNPANWFDDNYKFADGLDKITGAAKEYGESIGKAFQEGKAAGMADYNADQAAKEGVVKPEVEEPKPIVGIVKPKEGDVKYENGALYKFTSGNWVKETVKGGKGKKDKDEKNMKLSGSGGSGGKSITMNLTMNNNFNGVKNVDEVANLVIRQINDKLNDAFAVI